MRTMIAARGAALAVALAGLLFASPVRALAGDEADDHGGHANGAEEGEGTSFTVADFERAGVRLVTAGPGEVDLGVELPGEVRPNADRIAHLAPRFAGIVREVRAHVGDLVRAGDVLAIVESENLSPFELRAAFAGTVIDKHIAPGEAVARDEPAFIVADLSTVWVNVAVYQTALPGLRLGQPVVIAATHGALEATGTIAYITPVVDQATRTASARVVLPNADGAWRPGLFVSATVLDPVRATVVVPHRALQTMEGRPVVFVVEGEHLEPRAVQVGRVGRTTVEIVSGLAPGERLADERSFLVKAELGKGAAGHGH